MTERDLGAQSVSMSSSAGALATHERLARRSLAHLRQPVAALLWTREWLGTTRHEIFGDMLAIPDRPDLDAPDGLYVLNLHDGTTAWQVDADDSGADVEELVASEVLGIDDVLIVRWLYLPSGPGTDSGDWHSAHDLQSGARLWSRPLWADESGGAFFDLQVARHELIAIVGDGVPQLTEWDYEPDNGNWIALGGTDRSLNSVRLARIHPRTGDAIWASPELITDRNRLNTLDGSTQTATVIYEGLAVNVNSGELLADVPTAAHDDQASSGSRYTILGEHAHDLRIVRTTDGRPLLLPPIAAGAWAIALSDDFLVLEGPYPDDPERARLLCFALPNSSDAGQ